VAGGNTRFIEALATRLKPSQITTSARVTAIERTDSGVKLRVLERDSHFVDITGRIAAVTVPVNLLGRIQFSPPLGGKKWQAISTTKMGSYIKVNFRVSHEASKLWRADGENVFTLLSDTQAGSIYDVSDLQTDTEPRDQVLTLLLHARFARELVNQPLDDVRETSAAALDALFPGVRPHIKSAEIFVYPHAVAYWPLELGRSRFDELANELRRPEGRLYIGGDTTEDSHSEGAVVAALRMARQIIERRAELTTDASSGSTAAWSTPEGAGGDAMRAGAAGAR
jgi:monoamine oxidase